MMFCIFTLGEICVFVLNSVSLDDKFDGSAVDQPPHPVHGHDIAILQGRKEVRHPDDAGQIIIQSQGIPS